MIRVDRYDFIDQQKRLFGLIQDGRECLVKGLFQDECCNSILRCCRTFRIFKRETPAAQGGTLSESACRIL